MSKRDMNSYCTQVNRTKKFQNNKSMLKNILGAAALAGISVMGAQAAGAQDLENLNFLVEDNLTKPQTNPDSPVSDSIRNNKLATNPITKNSETFMLNLSDSVANSAPDISVMLNSFQHPNDAQIPSALEMANLQEISSNHVVLNSFQHLNNPQTLKQVQGDKDVAIAAPMGHAELVSAPSNHVMLNSFQHLNENGKNSKILNKFQNDRIFAQSGMPTGFASSVTPTLDKLQSSASTVIPTLGEYELTEYTTATPPEGKMPLYFNGKNIITPQGKQNLKMLACWHTWLVLPKLQ